MFNIRRRDYGGRDDPKSPSARREALWYLKPPFRVRVRARDTCWGPISQESKFQIDISLAQMGTFIGTLGSDVLGPSGLGKMTDM